MRNSIENVLYELDRERAFYKIINDIIHVLKVCNMHRPPDEVGEIYDWAYAEVIMRLELMEYFK